MQQQHVRHGSSQHAAGQAVIILRAAVYSTAITYELGARQYVVIPAGSALFTFALPGT
jgi:hypothetical protein